MSAEQGVACEVALSEGKETKKDEADRGRRHSEDVGNFVAANVAPSTEKNKKGRGKKTMAREASHSVGDD